ncbi:hypothetical protein VOLCADRAFT_92800 [Volvox carteri f. nagariensis]|uniref:EF-hand domain-containing protein n=1 Tax=Volvox carteri f. nagariensis TaxID=3068 RepID=D8U0H8_VOLCA|nr:uncharacterized protein VOLCADRAFT_92800 [Volvox carteri f. nagariensis]EFJ46635.1 hypothetical protein VOLCADRAFT_92800 [Volvox carteri f. nagariensis]|eukprot:XP_002952164.1 hypothetical protein VOLCADRAFT_92800 [Volvox carteri f. nagariensis]
MERSCVSLKAAVVVWVPNQLCRQMYCFKYPRRSAAGKPLSNVQVHLKAIPTNDPEKVVAKTVSNAFGNRAFSRKDGYVICKVLAGYSYRVAATASGYHDFGLMGESLLLTPKESEMLKAEVPMIPVRISVVITLRELRPIHQHDSMQHDTAGQVNPLTSMPQRQEVRSGVPPQKVSFYSSDGIKMDFVATTVESHDVLMGWPSALGNTAETAKCTLGVYSTDNAGHCYFYGPKLVAGAGAPGVKRNALGRKPGQREWTTIDVGRWEYARKYHLRTNAESPVFILFDDYCKQVDYPAHVARYPPRGTTRSPSPPRGRLAGPPGRSKEQIMSCFLENAAEVAAAASNGGSVVDPNEPTLPSVSNADNGEGAAVADEAPVSPVRTGSWHASGAAARLSRPASAMSRSKSTSRNLLQQSAGGGVGGEAVGATAFTAEGAEMALDAGSREEIDAEMQAYTDNNTHNYVDPGPYKLQMKDPSRLLIFYTYSGDGEAAEINQAQNAVVPFTMHAADESFIHPRDGTVMRNTNYPVQLYCRARPWFQIAVYDMATLEEVGASHGLSFTIERLTTTVVRSSQDSRSRGGGGGANELQLARSRRRRNNMMDDDDGHPLESYFDSDGGGRNDDSMVYPYKLEEVVESATVLHSGTLGGSKEKMWMTPGEKYRVSVQMRSPFLEYNAVQVRTCNWELEPFVFYAIKKVTQLVEVRESYNQLPIPNTEIVVEVQEPPQAPRPPVLKPEWCEDPKAYAYRVLDQLIDYVVQSNRERAAADEGPVKTYRGFTDAEGLVTFEMPPEARVYVRAVNTSDFEDTDASREVKLTTMAEQFVGIQLERITRTAAVVLDSNTNEGVPGFELRAYDVTDYTDMPRDGTRKSRHLLDMDMLDAIDTSQMEPFAVETTGPEGAINAPFCRRAGRVIKVEVTRTPRTHHMPSLVMSRGKNSIYVVTYDKQSVVFKAPPRPKIKVSCHDTCTFEEVHGVRFRIMVRPFGPPPPDMAGAGGPSRGGTRSLRVSVSRSSHTRSQAASVVSPSVRAPPSVAASVGVDPLDPDELAGAVELPIGELPSPALTAITTPGGGGAADAPTPSRESSSIRLLREQHRGTMAQIEDLESKLQAASTDAAGGGSDVLAPQRAQLEDLLGQLKAVMRQQQERLDAMVMAREKKMLARASALAIAAADPEAEEVESVLEQSTVGGRGSPEGPASPASGLRGASSSRGAASAAGSVHRSAHGLSLAVPEPAGNAAADSGLSPPAVGATSVRIREPPFAGGGATVGAAAATAATILGGGYSGVFGVFAGGVGRVMNRAGGGHDDDDDEEEAIRRLRAAEEEMMAVFNPAPEEQDPWGRIVWDSVTGMEENDDLILDADCEVAVQIFPAWPYDPRSQMLKGRCTGHVGPPEFRFYLPRDGNAFRFWLDRDNALPTFWDEENVPRLPFHPLARLQPSAPQERMLAHAHQEMKLLRPAANDGQERWEGGMTGDGSVTGIVGQFNGAGGTSFFIGGPKHAWTPRLQLNFNFNSAGGAAAAAAARHRMFFGGGGGGGGPDGGEGGSFLGAPGGGGADGGLYECESVLPDGSRVLHRTMSAMQFDPNDSGEDINDLAWQQLRLSDASYLPLERTRLLQFLTRWGSFPHVAGGHCKACSGVERPPDTNPLLLAEAPPTPRYMGDVPQAGFGVGFSSGWSRSGATTGGGDDAASRLGGGMSVDGAPGPLQRGPGGLLYKSRLMSRRELSARWVFESRPPPRPEGPAVRRYVPDRFARTHVIMSNSEAVYCKSPFFTWWLPNGGGVHVTMSDGLYRDLIPLIDSVAVRMLNEGRCEEGRFLLGHQVVDSFCGGVFIIDVSTAQPFSGVSFILEQLSKMFDYWASETPMGAPRPRFNILLCSREVIECWRSALGTVSHNLGKRLLPWYEDIKYKMPTAPGFNMVKALRTAGAMAKSEVPIFLLCGGLVENPLNTPSEMSKVLYEMQLACLNSQAPMQPVVAVELFPMPQARLESIAQVKSSQSGDEEVTEKRSMPVRMVGYDDASEVSVEEAAALGSNIFALLVESLNAGRIRLLEVFREVDKDGDHALDWQQLYRLVLRLVPDATPAHVRYVQLLLDCTGDNLVRYKDLAAAMRACGRGGISVSLRDKLEVQLVLHKMAIMMLLSKVTLGEMFAKYDHDQDGFWNERELSAMLKDFFPGLRPAEHQLLFDAWKGVDKNQDGRISLDEFNRAFSSGGVPGLPGSSILSHPDQIQRMKEAGELDDFTIMAMKATEENKRLDRVRAVGFPLSETLVRVAGATRGVHRRLDLGRARAFADRIDMRPLEAVRESLNNNLQQLLAFEEAYGKQLTYEFHHGRALRSSRAIPGSLTADPPSPSPSPSSAGRLTRPSNSARARIGSASSNSPFAATTGAAAAAAASSASPSQGGASPSRPRSAARSRPSSRPRSAATALSASVSAIPGAGASRPASAAAAAGGSGGGSARSSRPTSASKTRPPPPAVAAWVASASASDDPHLRKLAAIDPEASGGGAAAVGSPGSVSMPPIGRENSSNGSHPWTQGGHGGGAVLSRELSNRSSLLAGMSPGEGGGGSGDDPRLTGRQEYRPPSERSLQRPRASYGSREPSRGPSAEPSGASMGGGAAAETGGGGGSQTSRPSSAPARRRGGSGAASTADSAVSASMAMPPLAFSRLPSAAARRSLPLKTATIGFDADDADGLPNIPDPNASPGGGFVGHPSSGGGGGAGGRPMSATRRSGTRW